MEYEIMEQIIDFNKRIKDLNQVLMCNLNNEYRDILEEEVIRYKDLRDLLKNKLKHVLNLTINEIEEL